MSSAFKPSSTLNDDLKDKEKALALASSTDCIICFDILITHLPDKEKLKEKISVAHPPSFKQTHNQVKCPVFVTWKIKIESGGILSSLVGRSKEEKWELRGCIGTFSPTPKYDGITEYAKISAFSDRRFSPIKHSELSCLCVCVSLLHSFEKVNSAFDWVIGLHGIIINYTHTHNEEDDPPPPQKNKKNSKNSKNSDSSSSRTRNYSATFLPEVAKEQGWDHQTCLNHLLKKAGYTGSSSNIIYKEIKVERYQASKAVMNYQEYLHAKKNNHANSNNNNSNNNNNNSTNNNNNNNNKNNSDGNNVNASIVSSKKKRPWGPSN